MTDSGNKKSGKWVTWTWMEGKIWDLWMVVHFLAGLVMASFFHLFDISLVLALVGTFLMAIVWEIYERLNGIIEYVSNSIGDVVIALAAFFIVYLFFPDMSFGLEVAVFVIVTLLWLGMEVAGWLNYVKRTGKIFRG